MGTWRKTGVSTAGEEAKFGIGQDECAMVIDEMEGRGGGTTAAIDALKWVGAN